eukprot:Seg1903.4 transcript_id=Seg1903.4/GoldUCD/mRNA.D3Y31 product="Protein BROTHER of FT and TFL 1" protein_id=Seg1903.4/GoldUCD/D3Y31
MLRVVAVLFIVVLTAESRHHHHKHDAIRGKVTLRRHGSKTENAARRALVNKMGWDDLCTRAQFLSVSYPYNDLKSCGETFPIEALTSRPKVELDKLGKLTDKNLTLVMVDPDAPSNKNPSCRSWLHWIVSGTNTKVKDITEGRELVKYQPPSPPSGSGKHRYYFLLYEQNDKTVVVKDADDRCKFDVDAFATENDLDGPIAMSMVRTERP